VNKLKHGSQFAIHVVNSLFRVSLTPKISITFFIKSKMMPENFGADANALFSPTLVVGLIQLTRT